MPGRHGVTTPDEAPAGLHPAFRILLLLALAAMLFRYSLAAVALALAVLLLAAAAGGREVLRGVLQAARRIRWLLLSIVVIYLWIAPEPGGGSAWLPSWSELDLALRRSGVLLVLVVAVELLRRHTGPAHLAAGLVLLLGPLNRVGVEVEIFARRLALTLESVPQIAERVAAAATGRRAGPGGWGEAAAVLVRDIEQQAVEVPETARLPRLAPPGARDWAWLAAGVLLCLLASRL